MKILNLNYYIILLLLFELLYVTTIRLKRKQFFQQRTKYSFRLYSKYFNCL